MCICCECSIQYEGILLSKQSVDITNNKTVNLVQTYFGKKINKLKQKTIETEIRISQKY